ncbi:MAG: Holliday junction resolvase RuvX [Chthoniobacteraceae bacterium]
MTPASGWPFPTSFGMLAHPLKTLDARGKPLPEIVAIVAEKKIEIIILGLPKNMNGTEGHASEKSRAFAEKLKTAIPGCPVKLWDERLTSVAAQRSLHEAGRDTKKSRSVIDQAAAQILLQTYLDSVAM